MDLTRVGVFAIFFNLAVLIFLLLVFIPLPASCNWALLNWSHLGVLCFFTVPLSIILTLLFFRRVSYGKRFLFFFAGLVVLYALFFFGIHFEEDSSIKFNWFVSLLGLVSSWVLAAVPFLWKTRTSIISAIESERTEYALLTTSVMWMSPFLGAAGLAGLANERRVHRKS